MYAIVEIGANQYRVKPGENFLVDRLPGKVGETVEFSALLVVSDANRVSAGKDAAKIMVSAKILSHPQGEKLDISRFRHKVRHHRHIGFRPQLTKLQIMAIGKTELKTDKAVVKPKSIHRKTTPRNPSA